MKRSPKSIAAELLNAAGALRAARAARVSLLRRPALVILGYHRVAPVDRPFSPLSVAPADFERQLTLLARGRDVWPLERVADFLAGRERLRRDTLVLTFDDGYADNLEHAAPILTRLGMPATFFVTTGPILAGEPFWWDALRELLDRCPDTRYLEGLPAGGRVPGLLRDYVTAPEGRRRAPAAALMAILKRAPEAERSGLLAALRNILPAAGPRVAGPLLTVGQVGDLARQGFAIGGHGVTHAAFSTLDAAGRRAEAAGCREQLRALGIEARFFAYPYGDQGGEDGPRAVEEAGYRLAVTTVERAARVADAPLLLPRKVVPRQTPGQVATRIERLAWGPAA